MGAGEGTAELSAHARSRPAEPTWDDQPSGSPWRVLRGALLVFLLLLIAGAAFVGQRNVTLSHLEGAVATGEVDTVTIVGGLPQGSRGYGTAVVQWREGLFRYRTEVVEARPRGAAGFSTSGSDTQVVRNLGTRLSELRPELRVVRDDRVHFPSSSTVLGWHLPDWAGWLTFVLFLASLMLLVGGPKPWRATRWAWFWLWGVVPPVGLAAFLLLGGPSRLVPPPRAGARRLTGGWAFLLGILISVFTPDM